MGDEGALPFECLSVRISLAVLISVSPLLVVSGTIEAHHHLIFLKGNLLVTLAFNIRSINVLAIVSSSACLA